MQVGENPDAHESPVLNGLVDVYRDPTLRSAQLVNYAPASLCALQHYDGTSALQIYISLTQQDADWRRLAPHSLFEATPPPITGGKHHELKKEVSMNPNPDRIVRLKTVIFRSGISRSTIYRKMKDGTFPARVKVNINGIGWHESELNRWIANPPAYRAPDLQR
jgi:prophage regulatory protein